MGIHKPQSSELCSLISSCVFAFVARSLVVTPVVLDRREVGQVTWMTLAMEESVIWDPVDTLIQLSMAGS